MAVFVQLLLCGSVVLYYCVGDVDADSKWLKFSGVGIVVINHDIEVL